MKPNKIFLSKASVCEFVFTVFTIAWLFNTSAFALPTYQSFHADSNGRVTIWKTKLDERDKVLFGPKIVKDCFNYKWKDFGETDREILFEPLSSVNSYQKEAFFDAGIMNQWDDFWDSQPMPYYYEWPILADASDLMDIYVGVDLTVWTNSPVSFFFGDVIPIVDGRNDTLLPGYFIGTSPINYVLGTGWVTSSPLTTGNVVIAGSRDGEPIPEPSTLLLLGSGLAGLAGVRKKRLSKKA